LKSSRYDITGPVRNWKNTYYAQENREVNLMTLNDENSLKKTKGL